jgi:leucyl-tRNA synthetase
MSDTHAKCPHCEARIQHLTFKMVETHEERFTEAQTQEMKHEIARMQNELENDRNLDSTKKVLYKNRIEHFESELQNSVACYKERVYYCPSCEKVLSVIPSNDIMALMELVSAAAFDIRKLK